MQESIKNDASNQTVTFKIEGLGCYCEIQMVEKRLRSQKGVDNYKMNPISNQMKVSYNPTIVTIEEIQKNIAKAGVKAVLLNK